MNPLDSIMGTEEASERWGLSQDHIKRLCKRGKVKAKLIGKTWILIKDQPNPKQGVSDMNYTVVVTEEAGSPYPDYVIDASSISEAIEKAEEMAEKHPDKLVFVQFFRKSDGQSGYINRDGADIVGRSWT